MTLTSEIIQEAYREGNLIAIAQEPSANQSSEALKLLNRVVSGVYGEEVGDPLYDWPVGTSGVVATPNQWTQTEWSNLLQNVRIVVNADTAQDVYLPPDPDDGARVALVDPGALLATYPVTIYGNGRTIEDVTSLVLNTDSISRVWLYRADLGKWVRLTALVNTVDEEFPFPTEFDSFFITRLAMRLNPRYGRSMSEETAAELTSVLRKMRARYRQKQVIPADLGVLMLTGGVVGRQMPNIVRGRIGWMR